jgi:hypothetical protein
VVDYNKPERLVGDKNWAQKARVIVNSKPLWHIVVYRSCLLGLLVSYKENEVLRIRLQGLYSQAFLFFV